MSTINKVCVINASPKGEYSVTLQTTRYLEILHKDIAFEVVNVGAKLAYYIHHLDELVDKIRDADLIIFSYPVYTFIAPYQLHRIIEALKERGADFDGKYATQITTSKHFYDYTAHRYVVDNAQDLGLKMIAGLSADMDDLTTDKGQQQAERFFNYVLFAVDNDIYIERTAQYTAPKHNPVQDVPTTLEVKDGDVVIVTDCREEDKQLSSMIESFRGLCKRSTRVVNIRQYPFQGGCRGCFHCAPKGECIYKDGFDEFLRENIQKADAIVLAFSIQDHSMGATFKLYDDRQFCNGHRTVTMGMPMGYIVSGNLSEEENLRTIIEGRANVGGNFLAGVATDEGDTTSSIAKMAKTLDYALDNGYAPPSNFLGVGGMKIFRDLIYEMRGMMKADHAFYKSHGQYDFPQKYRARSMAMYLVGALMSNKKLMAKAGNNVNEGMLMPYKKALENARKKSSNGK